MSAMLAALRHAQNLTTILGDHGFRAGTFDVNADDPDYVSIGVHLADRTVLARHVADALALPIIGGNDFPGPGQVFSTVTADFRGVPVTFYGALDLARVEAATS